MARVRLQVGKKIRAFVKKYSLHTKPACKKPILCDIILSLKILPTATSPREKRRGFVFEGVQSADCIQGNRRAETVQTQPPQQRRGGRRGRGEHKRIRVQSSDRNRYGRRDYRGAYKAESGAEARACGSSVHNSGRLNARPNKSVSACGQQNRRACRMGLRAFTVRA